MAIIGEWIRRIGYLLRRGAREHELRLEMEAHRAEMGEPPAFGNLLRLRDEARDAWGWRWLDEMVQDTRFAWRTLRHGPGFAVTAMATLALGIGANTAMFSLVNGLLLRPLYAGVDDVVEVHGRRTAPVRIRDFSYPNYRDLQEGTTGIFESLAAASTDFVGLDAGDRPRSALASAVTANYFQVFDAMPAHGRAFTLEEERPGAGIRAAIVSYPLWEQLGADQAALGRRIRINGEEFTVVGVAQNGFVGTSIPGPEVWLPLGAYETFRGGSEQGRRLGSREAHGLSVIGRLRPGVLAETAEAALGTAGRRLEQAFPSVNAGYSLVMSTPDRSLLFLPGGSGALTGPALLLMLMPLIVLLAACLNLANLLLARGHARRQELAIRSSLGGGRSRLIRQLLTEGLLLALAGGAVGLWLSTLATDALLASLRQVLPVAVTLPAVGPDWRVLAGTIAFCLAATLIVGAGPAWAQTRRAAAAGLEQRIGGDGRQGSVRIGNALIAGQIALSVLLLASGGLFTMSVIRAAAADPGFRLDGGVIVEVDPGLAGYDEARGRQAQLALIERLRTVPGVEAVTIGSRPPFTSIGDSRAVAPAGAADARSSSVDAVFSVVGRDYARVLGLPLLAGRDFSDADLTPGSGARVAIIDAALAEELWPGEDALGRLIQFLDAEGPDARGPMLVVGIIPAVKHSLGNPRPYPHVYVPLGQHYESAMTLQLRVAGGESERDMPATIARVVRDVDERLPVLSVATWRDYLDAGLDVRLRRAGAGVFSAFGGMALLLAVLGVYGVKSYVVSRRTREFGIRIAIGAPPRAVLWQVLREGGGITAVGIAIGLVLALGAGQFLQSILYGVNRVEPLVLGTAPLILFAASLLASYIPARRATRVDPTLALRSE